MFVFCERIDLLLFLNSNNCVCVSASLINVSHHVVVSIITGHYLAAVVPVIEVVYKPLLCVKRSSLLMCKLLHLQAVNSIYQ